MAGIGVGIINISTTECNIKASPAAEATYSSSIKKKSNTDFKIPALSFELTVGKPLPQSARGWGRESRGTQILALISLDQRWHLITEKESKASRRNAPSGVYNDLGR